MKLNLVICPLLDLTINASATVHFQIRTVKGHILPFPLLMKCQVIDLPFLNANLPSSLTFHPCSCDVSEPVEVIAQPERCWCGSGKSHQG